MKISVLHEAAKVTARERESFLLVLHSSGRKTNYIEYFGRPNGAFRTISDVYLRVRGRS